MTGPSHYAEAERLLTAYKEAWQVVEEMPVETVRDSERRMHAADGARQLVAKAQVHATLALAAASAYPAVKDYCGDEARDSAEWTRVTA